MNEAPTPEQYADAVAQMRDRIAALFQMPPGTFSGPAFSGEAMALRHVAAGAMAAGSAHGFLDARRREAQEAAALAALGYADPADVERLKALCLQTGRPAADLARIVAPGTLRRAVAGFSQIKTDAALGHGAGKTLALADLHALRDAFGVGAGGLVGADRTPAKAKRPGKRGGPGHPAARSKGGKRRR